MDATVESKPNGLVTYLQTLWAPSEAFATLARFPMWGWAAVAGIILTLIAGFLALPATEHYSLAMQQQQMQQLPADQRAQMGKAMEFTAKFFPFFTLGGALFGTWISWLITSIVFVLAAALGGGDAKFGRAWVAAVNLYVVYVVVSLVNALIVLLRGAEAASTSADLYALPSLAYLVHGNPKLAAALYSVNIGFIWYYVVTAIALMVMMKLSRTAAIVTAVILAFIGTAFLVVFAR